MGPERLYHEPPEAICVNLTARGQPFPETERYFIVPDLIVDGRQIQLPYGVAKDLGLTPKVETQPTTVEPLKIDKRVFKNVTDLTEIAKAKPDLVRQVWDEIRARCQQTTNEAQ